MFRVDNRLAGGRWRAAAVLCGTILGVGKDDAKWAARQKKISGISKRLLKVQSALIEHVTDELLTELDTLIEDAIKVGSSELAIAAVWNRRVDWRNGSVPPSKLPALPRNYYVWMLTEAFRKSNEDVGLKKVSAAVDAMQREITRQYAEFEPTLAGYFAAFALYRIDPDDQLAADTVCWLASIGDGIAAHLVTDRDHPETRLNLVATMRTERVSEQVLAMSVSVAAGIPDHRVVERLTRACRRAESNCPRIVEDAHTAVMWAFENVIDDDDPLEDWITETHPTPERAAEMYAAIDKLTPVECVEDAIAAMFSDMNGGDVLALAQRFVEAGMNGDEAAAWLAENRDDLEAGLSDEDGTPFLPLWLGSIPDKETDTA